MTYQCQEGDILQDLIDEQTVKRLEPISFDVSIELINLNNLDEHNEIVVILIVLQTIED